MQVSFGERSLPRTLNQERFALYLPGPTLDELRAESARVQVPVAELVRRAVDFYLIFKDRNVAFVPRPTTSPADGG